MDKIPRFIQIIRDFLAPDICPVCKNDIVAPGQKICPNCHSQLAFLPERRCPNCGGPADSLLAQCRECLKLEERPWQLAVSAFAFEGILRTAIHKLKYRGGRELAPFFAHHLAQNWRKYSQDFKPDVITAIPIHWTRWLYRGYNQAAEVAQFLAQELHLPCQTLLRRTQRTKAQAKLNAKERMGNLKHAFKASDAAEGLRILLVDDVFTTGSTLAAATQALLKKKARGVAVITIARDL